MEIVMDEFELKSKFKNWYKMPRELVLDLFSKKITQSQFSLLLIYVSFTCFDNRNAKYAATDVSNRKLSQIIGFNKDKIAQNKKILWVKGYIEIRKRKKNKSDIIRINNPERFFIDMVSKYKDTLSKSQDVKQV